MPGDNASAVGTVFDIKQLAVYDGPGIRTTVFLKGCPLRCMWCHNPEGLSYQPQLMVSSNNCLHCGACVRACPNGGKSCTACGQCIRACPQGLRKLCGKRYTAQELAWKLLRDKDYLAAMSGGVTFSGGEPTGSRSSCWKRWTASRGCTARSKRAAIAAGAYLKPCWRGSSMS